MADSGTVARLTARMLERRHVTRAGVTRISVLAAVGAAVWFSRADMVGGLAGSAFLVVILFCDAVRARMRTQRRDALTLWLAAMLSQLREYVVYLGLAAGAVAAGISGAWGWAAGALVALALRDSLLVAGSAPAAPPLDRSAGRPTLFPQGRSGGLLGGLTPQPAPRPGESDPELTSRLFGTTVVSGTRATRESPSAGVVHGASGIRWEEAKPAKAGEAVSRCHTAYTTLPPPGLARRLMSFSQPARFLVVAVTATLWDARVAFITLIVGCAVTATAELVGPADHEDHR